MISYIIKLHVYFITLFHLVSCECFEVLSPHLIYRCVLYSIKSVNELLVSPNCLFIFYWFILSIICLSPSSVLTFRHVQPVNPQGVKIKEGFTRIYGRTRKRDKIITSDFVCFPYSSAHLCKRLSTWPTQEIHSLY